PAGARPPVIGRRRRKPVNQLAEMRVRCAMSKRPIAPQRAKLGSSAACTKAPVGYSERCLVRKPMKPTATTCTWILPHASATRFANRKHQCHFRPPREKAGLRTAVVEGEAGNDQKACLSP